MDFCGTRGILLGVRGRGRGIGWLWETWWKMGFSVGHILGCGWEWDRDRVRKSERLLK